MSLSSIQPYESLPFSGVQLPDIAIPPEERAKHSVKSEGNLEFLTQLCRNAFKEREAKGLIPRERRKEYADRVKMELAVIEELGFVSYILMVRDICRFADEQGIPRGPGRGSVAGSLVCNLIGMTALDPIEHGMFFARFLSKARAKAKVVNGVRYIEGSFVPDVDLDFSFYRRQEIIDYLVARYPGQTAKLLTTGTLTSKALIKDVLKVYEGVGEDQAGAASDLLQKKHGNPEEIEDALSDDPEKANEPFKLWAKEHRETVELAMELSGLNRSEGVHASALAICAYKIDDLLPLQRAINRETEEEFVVTGLDMYSAQEVVLKFDILGLKTLDVVKDVCDLLHIERDKIDVHHECIYRELQDFKNRYGIFQLETFAQGSAAEKMRPMDFEQLTMVLAIARPGAFAYLDQLIRYLHKGEYTSIHPLIDDILRPTGGVAIYQETYLAMLIKIGLTPEEADNARRVLGKKLVKEVPGVKQLIGEVCARNGHPVEIVNLLQKIAEDSGGFSFNLAHAASYATITAWTLYLKSQYPLQFYWALLRMARHEQDGHEVVATIEKELRAAGFALLPPHFVHSSTDFTIETDKAIRFGLGMIRGVSEKTMTKLEAFRNESPADEIKFKVFQSLKNAGLNVGVGSALVQAGCMAGYEVYARKDGSTHKSRPRLVLELLTWNVLTDKEKALCISIANKPEVAHDVLNAILYLRDNSDEKGKPLIKASRFATIQKRYEPYKVIYEMNRRNERLANFWYERRVLGYSYSENLRGIFGEHVDGLDSVAEVRESAPKTRVRIIGFASDCYKTKTKAGNDCFKFRVTDETGEITVKMFNTKIDACAALNGRMPDEDDLIVCNGTNMDNQVVFLDEVAIQTAKIYLRLSELKDKSKKVGENDGESPNAIPEKGA